MVGARARSVDSPEVTTRAPLPRPAAKRLSLYLRECEQLLIENETHVSSEVLAGRLGLTASQVRRDLAYVAQAGQRGVGYDIRGLLDILQREFGLARDWRAVLVGVGNIGRALLGYAPFRNANISIVAAFDADPGVVGGTWGGRVVRPMSDLSKTVRDQRVELAVLAVPGAAAQGVATELAAAGIRGILNFAPVRVVVPPGVAANTVDFSTELRRLAMGVAQMSQDNGADADGRKAS